VRGSGKTVPARRLGAQFEIPVIHLDEIFYEAWTRCPPTSSKPRRSLILAAQVSQNPTDHHELPDVLDAVTTNLAAAGITPTRHTQTPAEPDQHTDDQHTDEELSRLAGRDDELGVVTADAGYANEETFQAVEDADLLLLAPLASDEKLQQDTDPAAGRDLSSRPATARSQRRLRTATGKDLYKIRGRSVEPVFGQLKDRRGLRQFTTHGLDNVTTEFTLGCTIHNILKLISRRAVQATT
jgi:hypothetical protein